MDSKCGIVVLPNRAERVFERKVVVAVAVAAEQAVSHTFEATAALEMHTGMAVVVAAIPIAALILLVGIRSVADVDLAQGHGWECFALREHCAQHHVVSRRSTKESRLSRRSSSTTPSWAHSV